MGPTTPASARVAINEAAERIAAVAARAKAVFRIVFSFAIFFNAKLGRKARLIQRNGEAKTFVPQWLESWKMP
jgi:hypothetical protein